MHSIKPFLDISGYQPKTTFWQDFEIANAFGKKAVEDTFNRAFEEWKTDVVYLTELVLILNWQMWMWHDLDNDDMGMLYNNLWEKADQWAMENLKDDDLKYFLHTTD